MPKSKILRDMMTPYPQYNPLSEVEYGFDPKCVKAYKNKSDIVELVCQSKGESRNIWGRRYLQAAPFCNLEFIGVVNSDGNNYAINSILREEETYAIIDVTALRKINGSWLDKLTSVGTRFLGALGFNVVDNGMYTPAGHIGKVLVVKNKKALLDPSLPLDSEMYVWEGL